MDNRRSKENYYLDIADAVLQRSTCLRRMYGARRTLSRTENIMSLRAASTGQCGNSRRSLSAFWRKIRVEKRSVQIWMERV